MGYEWGFMKVFISSTYKDLIEHRNAVVNALRTMGEEVDHMEIFGARDEEPTKASLIELDKCDVLVGIYSYRYGTVPKGSKISVTEQEYLHAEKKKMPILVFVVNESHSWLPNSMDKSLGKVRKFKSKVSSDHTPAYFTTPDNLASQVVSAVGKLIKENSNAFGRHQVTTTPELEKTTSIRWGERNLEAVAYFVNLCRELDKADEDHLVMTLKSWGLLGPTKDGLNFSVDGAVLFGPTDRLPVGFHTDVLIEDNRYSPEKLKVLNGRCLMAIIKELNDYLDEFWQDAWEDPLERDNLGRPKKITKYPQTAIVEAMVNFVIHRDYSMDDLALISIENDHIEFTNPGISSYTEDELLLSTKRLYPRYQKNNLIIKSISRTSLNQRQGRGIIRIRKALVENGNLIGEGNLGLEIENRIEQNRFRLRIYQKEQPPVKPLVTPGAFGSTLPQQPFFFGRADELKIIASAIAPESRTWGALIDGPGGIGKTALAVRAAHNAPADLFERKIFITAKVRELTPEGEKPLKDFSRDNYFSMLNELALELGEDGIPRLAPDERANPLRIAMSGKKILVVFDNLETLPEEERVRLFQFLSRLPAGNKAIVSSRRRADVDARIIRLDRLSHDEATQLVDELAMRNPRLRRASPKERDELYEITQGNPLFIRWIAGQLGREGSQCRTISEAFAFIEKAPKGNDPLEYIFGDLLETFTDSETKALAALTHFTQPAKLKWIAQMTELPERAAETALEDLADRSILIANIEARTFYLPPLAAQFIKTRRPEAVTQTGDALTNRAYALAMQYGGDTNYEGFKTLDAEWALLAAALPRFLQGENVRLQSVCSQLSFFLDFTGRWDERISISEQAEARALVAGDKDKAGWRAYQAGYTYGLRNQPDLVLACAARAASHWTDKPPRDKAVAIRLRGVGHALQKDYPAAIAAYREALEIHRSISPESDNVSIALNSLAEAERANKDYAAAERNYREALRIARKINQQESIAIYTGNLASLALDREQWAEAETLAREALPLAERIGRQELIAEDSRRIAKASLKQKRIDDETLSLAQRAVEIYTRLRSGDLQEAEETLSEIEQARGE
jgi:tetratricopeptide (TPR) repeat protein